VRSNERDRLYRALSCDCGNDIVADGGRS